MDKLLLRRQDRIAVRMVEDAEASGRIKVRIKIRPLAINKSYATAS